MRPILWAMSTTRKAQTILFFPCFPITVHHFCNNQLPPSLPSPPLPPAARPFSTLRYIRCTICLIWSGLPAGALADYRSDQFVRFFSLAFSRLLPSSPSLPHLSIPFIHYTFLCLCLCFCFLFLSLLPLLSFAACLFRGCGLSFASSQPSGYNTNPML